MAQRTKGFCKYCGKEYAKSGMLRHLPTCKERKAKLEGVSGNKKGGYYELVITGKYDNDYWLIIEIKETATLEDLDEFIRDIWVECCGHLSAFTINGEEYESDPDTDSFWGESENMDHRLKDVLTVGDTMEYEYDFGSTTELTIKVQDYRKGYGESDVITLLSRNNSIKLLCSHCGKNEARWIDAEEIYGEKPFWCDECLEKEYPDGEDEELYLLPVCNSPRMGVCDYEGSDKYPDQFVPDTQSESDTGEKAKEQELYRALVVVDMQNDFITGSLGNEDCQKVVAEVVRVIKSGDYDEVFLTRDTHGPDYLKTHEGSRLPVIHTQKGTEGWQIQEDVMNAVNQTFDTGQIILMDKPCFGSEELAEQLKKLEAECKKAGRVLQVDFTGVCTDICVISNVFLAKAAVPEAEIRVLAHACAGVTLQTHRTALDAMQNCQVDII